MVPRPARRASRPLGVALVVLVLALASGSAVQPHAIAATAEVLVERAGYAPEAITIRVGDTVVWRWTVDGGSVTAEDGSFDSHPDCPGFDRDDCGREGETFAHTFEEVGEYDYVSRFPRFSGTVFVEPAPPQPSPPTETEPSDDPSPSPTGSGGPVPSPTPPSPSPSPSPSPTRSSEPPPPAPSDDPDPPPADDGSEPDATTRTAASSTLEGERATADDSETPTLAAPSVADDEPSPVPEPTFEDFPDAPEPTPAGQDVEGEVAITSPDEDGTSRVVWSTVGGLTVLGTLGAFGRRVLFADPWES